MRMRSTRALLCFFFLLPCWGHVGYYIRKPTTSNTTDSVTYVKADLLIPGKGDPITSGVLVYFDINGTIAYAGPSSSAPVFSNVSKTWGFPVVMPGMWDVHTHYGGTTCAALNDGTSVFNDLAGGYKPHTYRNMGCALQMLRETICAGVTSVRELGGTYGQALFELTESGLFPAPHFHFASKPIGMTGGHTDEQYLPIQVTRADYNSEWDNFGAICDGVAECLKKVREQLRAQSDVIKIMTTGGVLSAFDQPTDQEFSLEEVTAMVQEAARAGRSCAAHAHGADGIAVAIAAGVHTLEHGSYLNSTLVSMLKSKDMVYVPTITIAQTFNRTVRPPMYDPDQWAKGQAVLEHNANAVRLALAAGVTIATGTDCPGTCAQVAQEAVYLNSLFGATPLQAIESLTANGPLTMGLRTPKSGQLAQGFEADFIVLSSSPLTNLTMLTDPNQVTYVFKSGSLVKSPSNGLCTNSATNPPGQWVVTDM